MASATPGYADAFRPNSPARVAASSASTGDRRQHFVAPLLAGISRHVFVCLHPPRPVVVAYHATKPVACTAGHAENDNLSSLHVRVERVIYSSRHLAFTLSHFSCVFAEGRIIRLTPRTRKGVDGLHEPPYKQSPVSLLRDIGRACIVAPFNVTADTDARTMI